MSSDDNVLPGLEKSFDSSHESHVDERCAETSTLPIDHRAEAADHDWSADTESAHVDPWALSDSESLSGETKTESLNTGSASKIPETIGRYQILERLGQGGFAVVYLANDTDLERLVAIKVPRPDRFTSDRLLAVFVEEARKTAQFDHRRIVQVYDVQREPGRVYIVQQFIEGNNLALYAGTHALSYRDIACLMIQVAEAVGYANGRGIIHRDLKPSNILMDSDGQPHVADFGLAIDEANQEVCSGEFAGTVPYMSPEQTLGETHRLDHRSDIWALGVILYQLLVKRLPFVGDSREELLREINHHHAKPLQDFDPSVPRELSRICLTCLAKRAIDRYQSASELGEDLALWLDGNASDGNNVGEFESTSMARFDTLDLPGLRSFEAKHSTFFQSLLPGPHDRTGLSRGVLFWKNRIEERDASATFSVGVMYGPSGCGKSSLVKAGILPALSDNRIISISVDSSSRDLPAKIERLLRQACPELPEHGDLAVLIGKIRSANGSRGRKVLIVIDQFEQFLHASQEREFDQLVRALRQCNGSDIQGLLLVRDDFFVSLNRFFQRLEIPILEGENSALVDLFDPDHAQRVLTILGRAFGKIPNGGDVPADQRRFIDRVVRGLAENERVVCVRLTAFAEMMKLRPWNMTNLREVGGTSGIGQAFLEEKFSKPTSPPNYRLHEDAASRVLQLLVSETSGGLKGPKRSHDELRHASGYEQRPTDFDSLMHILDQELRIITPTEADESDPTTETVEKQKLYQLSHDYLVHSVHGWIASKQKQTWAGCAELRLVERTTQYAAKPDRRHLPNIIDCLKITLLTRRRDWTAFQRVMMRRAQRLHLLRSVGVLILALALGWIGYEIRENVHSHSLVAQLLLASDPVSVTAIVGELKSYPSARSILEAYLDEPALTVDEKAQQVNIRIALQQFDSIQTSRLRSDIVNPDLPVRYVSILQRILLRATHSPEVTQFAEQLRTKVLGNASEPEQRRFRAGLALALYDASPEAWSTAECEFMANGYLKADPEDQAQLRDYLRPLSASVLPPLESHFSSLDLPPMQQLAATKLFVDYLKDDPESLAKLLCIANPDEFNLMYDAYSKTATLASTKTLFEIARKPPQGSPTERLQLGRQRAGAAIALLRSGKPQAVFSVLQVTDDPEALTQFVHGCRDRQVDPRPLLDCLSSVGEPSEERRDKLRESVPFGLLLALGEYEFDQVPDRDRQSVVERIARWYEFHPSSGVHGAAGWLLRRWGNHDAVARVDQTQIDYEPGREWYTVRVESPDQPLFFTFIVFDAGHYDVGSPEDSPTYKRAEKIRRVEIERPFAILDREITRAEYHALCKRLPDTPDWVNPAMPLARPTWYHAVNFCRKLGEQWAITESDQPYTAPNLLPPKLYPRDQVTSSNKWARKWPMNWPLDRDCRGFRLPTEAEWEVACRAGTRTSWSFSDDMRWLSYYGAVNEGPFWSARKVELPKTFRPNLRGLFDFYGNRNEWCHDWHGLYRTLGEVDIAGPDNGAARVVRGGNYRNTGEVCRSANREQSAPAGHPGNIGFRIVTRPLPPPTLNGMAPAAGPPAARRQRPVDLVDDLK